MIDTSSIAVPPFDYPTVAHEAREGHPSHQGSSVRPRGADEEDQLKPAGGHTAQGAARPYREPPVPPRKAVRFTGRSGVPNHGLGEGAELRGRVIPLWTPTAEGFFSRVSAPYLKSLFLDLTGCGEDSTCFKAWKALKKAEKAASMERLVTEPDYQAVWQIDAEKNARIEAWKPGCI